MALHIFGKMDHEHFPERVIFSEMAFGLPRENRMSETSSIIPPNMIHDVAVCSFFPWPESTQSTH